MTASQPVPSLADRTGLPDAIAYLRGDYPASGWRQARTFGGLAAFWLDVHASLRREGAQLDATTTALREGTLETDAFTRAFVPQINRFLSHLDGHHGIEDAVYFPKFRALDPRMATGFDVLDADHLQIHSALQASVESARALLAALQRGAEAARHPADAYASHADRLVVLLHRHLADEEDLVLPALLHHGERALG